MTVVDKVGSMKAVRSRQRYGKKVWVLALSGQVKACGLQEHESRTRSRIRRTGEIAGQWTGGGHGMQALEVCVEVEQVPLGQWQNDITAQRNEQGFQCTSVC